MFKTISATFVLNSRCNFFLLPAIGLAIRAKFRSLSCELSTEPPSPRIQLSETVLLANVLHLLNIQALRAFCTKKTSKWFKMCWLGPRPRVSTTSGKNKSCKKMQNPCASQRRRHHFHFERRWHLPPLPNLLPQDSIPSQTSDRSDIFWFTTSPVVHRAKILAMKT